MYRRQWLGEYFIFEKPNGERLVLEWDEWQAWLPPGWDLKDWFKAPTVDNASVQYSIRRIMRTRECDIGVAATLCTSEI